MTARRGITIRTLAVGAVSALAALAISTSAGIGDANATQCAGVIAIGVPGTNQGLAHSNGKTDAVSAYGKQVATAMNVFSSKILNLSTVALNYSAIGVGGPLGSDAAIARVAYNASIYKKSKDAGYSGLYGSISSLAKKCPSARFAVIGYSQGAHIAGDIAQSILHGNGPVGRSRLAAAVLIADPAYNGKSPRSNEFRFDGTEADAKAKRRTLVNDNNHWAISGALGKRAAFGANDPVISVCVYGDPVCDGGADGLNARAAQAKAWMHTKLYTDVKYGSTSLAAWAGGVGVAFITR